MKENISYIKAPITNKKPEKTVSLATVAKAIKTNPYYKRITEEYRDLLKEENANEKERRKKKVQSFDYVTMSGEFSYVSSKNLIKHSGYICVDIDKLKTEEEVERVKNKLLNDTEIDTALLFISPGGKGIKWTIAIDVESVKDHEDYYHAIEAYLLNEYGIEVDTACKDVARACFLSYDENVVFNPRAQNISQEFLKTWKSELANISPSKGTVSVTGDTPWDEYNKKGDLGKLLQQHGYTYVKSDELADRYLRPNHSGGSEYSVVVYRDTGLGYVHSSECYPLPIGTITPAKAFCLLEAGGDWGEAAKLLKELGYGKDEVKERPQLNLIAGDNLPANVIPFWEIDDKGRCSINMMKFIDFLEKTLELGAIKLWDMDRKQLVKKEDNILKYVNKEDIGYLVRKFMDDHIKPYNTDFHSLVANTFYKFWTEGQRVRLLDMFKIMQPKMFEERLDTAYVYFSNGYVKVMKDEKEFHPYKTINTHIWEKEILERPYQGEVDYSNFSFVDFCKKVSGEDPERYDSLRKAYGYLLHSYKDPAITKAVIFTDEKLSEDLQADSGGTGKSIAAKAVSYMKPTREISGKFFKPDSNFAFATVRYGDRIVYFDDIRYSLDFRDLYNILTNDFKIERKGKDPVMIPFKDSPKVVMTSNHAIRGYSDSYIRRQLIVEFAPYFNPKKTVKDEYGEIFFDYQFWGNDKWAQFDSFMLDCIQLYLKEGLSERLINYHKKQVLQEIGPELFEYLNDNIKVPGFYSTRELLHGKKPKDQINGFRIEYPEYKLTSLNLGPRLEAWCSFKGYTITRDRTNKIRGYSFDYGDFPVEEGL